jgi:beta-galactosidase
MAGYVKWQHRKVKLEDPLHPTMTNSFMFVNKDPLGTLIAVDPWLLAESCDALGFDLYPGVANNLEERPEFTSFFLDSGYSAAKHSGKEFWVPEIQSGPIGGWFAGPYDEGAPRDTARFAMECLAHGSKVQLYIGWRERKALSLRWDSLCDFEGKPTSRLEATAEVARLYKRHKDILLGSTPLGAQIAILYDGRSGIVASGVGEDDLVHHALAGLYRALWEEGLRVEIVRADLLKPNELDQYRLIVMPAAVCVSDVTGAILTQYVEKGGWLITSANCGYLNERGWRHVEVPGAGLSKLAGVKQSSIRAVKSVGILIGGIVGQHRELALGEGHLETLELVEDVEILGSFATTGSPAITKRRVGAGHAIHIGSHMDLAYWSTRNAENRKFFAWVADQSGVTPPVRLKAGYPPGILDVHLLENGPRRLVIVTNLIDDMTHAIIEVVSAGQPIISDLFTDEGYTPKASANGKYEIGIAVPPKGFVVLDILKG